MSQRAAVFAGQASVQIELPSPEEVVLPGLRWGSIEAFPTPAYWAYQVLACRLVDQPVRYRLGSSLHEELAACLLGGHGIPARVGVAAFQRLRSRGMLAGEPTEQDLLAQLTEPLSIDGRPVRYRFAKQKARYLSAALRTIQVSPPSTATGRSLRDSLIALPGVGLKTASWIARNWLDADDVAILDIHVLRAGTLTGFLDSSLRVDRDYLALEDQFLAFSRAIGVRASELDALIWLEMASSFSTVRRLMHNEPSDARSTRRSHIRRTHPNQGVLLD
jgi:N-glycosylase/DNA lyase